MEPNVSDNSCHGFESIRVCKLHEILKRSTGESLFFPSIKSSERALHSSAEKKQRHSRTAVDGKSQISRVAPSIEKIYFQRASIEISISATVFFELGMHEFKGRTMSLGCTRS
jgi:hypothetical protein